jgi:hypothetical protein
VNGEFQIESTNGILNSQFSIAPWSTGGLGAQVQARQADAAVLGAKSDQTENVSKVVHSCPAKPSEGPLLRKKRGFAS